MSRVALIHNLNRGADERETEFDSLETIDMLQTMIAARHDCEPIEATRDMTWLPLLIDYRPDIVFNVAEGFHGAAREAVYPALFEQLEITYCGPDPMNLTVTLNKHLTKQLVGTIQSLEIPDSYIWNGQDTSSVLRNGRYILKLMHEGSSIGMHLADSPEEVQETACSMQKQYNDNVMIEEYIEGRDISMAYVEALGVVGPALVSLPGEEQFYDYRLKSGGDGEVQIGAEAYNRGLQSKLKTVTAALVRRLDLRGYAKIDFRLRDDTIHLVEVNAQVSFHPEGEFAHCCCADGHSLHDIVHMIINNGLKSKRRPSVGVQI